MSGEDFIEDQDDFFFDDDYLYVEDDITAADELAESQIPSPGYAGTNAELANEVYEYDLYEYYADLKYGSDSYWDSTPRKKKSKKVLAITNDDVESGQKRKRSSKNRQVPDKKRKIENSHERGMTDTDDHINNVLYRHAVNQNEREVPVVAADDKSFALFPDWKERFPVDVEVSINTAMPEEMKRAAESDQHGSEARAQEVENVTQVIPQISSKKKRKAQSTKRVEVVDDELDEAENENGLDMAAIQSILQQRLGNAGLKSDQFMETISKMLSGGASSDEAMEALATTLLDQTNGGDEVAENWLKQQGVTFDAEQDDDDEDTSARRIDSGAGLVIDTPDKASNPTVTNPPVNKKRKADDEIIGDVAETSNKRQTRSSPRKTRKAK